MYMLCNAENRIEYAKVEKIKDRNNLTNFKKNITISKKNIEILEEKSENEMTFNEKMTYGAYAVHGIILILVTIFMFKNTDNKTFKEQIISVKEETEEFTEKRESSLPNKGTMIKEKAEKSVEKFSDTIQVAKREIKDKVANIVDDFKSPENTKVNEVKENENITLTEVKKDISNEQNSPSKIPNDQTSPNQISINVMPPKNFSKTGKSSVNTSPKSPNKKELTVLSVVNEANNLDTSIKVNAESPKSPNKKALTVPSAVNEANNSDTSSKVGNKQLNTAVITEIKTGENIKTSEQGTLQVETTTEIASNNNQTEAFLNVTKEDPAEEFKKKRSLSPTK